MLSLFFRSIPKKAKPRRGKLRYQRLLLESLETRALPAPLAPTGLTQTGETVSTATLSWTASTDPVGISHYVVYSDVPHGHSGRGGGITYVYTAVASSTTTSATVTGLYANSSGWYVVDEINNDGVDSGHSYVYTLHTLPDTVPPTITVPADVTVTTNTPSGTQVTSAFAATGSDPGPGLDTITVDYFVNGALISNSYLFPLGPTTVTAYDLYGQSASSTFKVTVLNATGPTLTLPANQTAEATSAAGALDPAAFTASAVDLTAPNPTITYQVGTTPIDSNYTFPLGTTTVNVTATDTDGASASGTFTVTVRDTTPPTLSVPGNVTVEATSPAGALAPAAFTATATDLVTANPTIVYSSYIFGLQTINSTFVFPIGTTYVTVEATDQAGNTATQSLYVTVQDTTPPALTLPPNQVVSPLGPAGATDAAAFTASATDIASASPPTITYSVGTAVIGPTYTFPLGVTTTVLVKATDSAGNVSSGTFTVTVPAPPGLTLFVPADQTLQASSATGALDPAAFTTVAFDPGTTPTISYTVGGTPIDSSTLFPVGTTTVTVAASDKAGNSKSGTFTVTVQAPPTTTPLPPLAWTAGVNLPVGIADAAAYTVSTGILLFGGASATGNGSSVYNLAPSSTTWVADPSLDRGYVAPAVGETNNNGPSHPGDEGGIVYKYSSDLFVYGGADAGASSKGVVNYDPFPGTNLGHIVNAPSLSTARSALAYVADPANGDLYAIGGLNQSGTALASAEVYNPNTDSWSAIAPLPQPLFGAACFADGAGHLFVLGGDNSAGVPVATAYRYTIATNTWDTVAALPVATSYAAGALAPNCTFYLMGGQTASGAVANVLVYNPAANTWSTATPLPAPEYGAAATVDGNGNLEVIGGYNSAGQLQTTVLVSQNLPPALPTHVAIVQAPPASVGTNQVVTVTVAVEDAAGNVVTSQSGSSMNVNIAGPDGITSVGTAAVTIIGGTASFSLNSADYSASPGMYTLQFSDDPLPGASVTFGIGASLAVPTVTVSGGTFTYDGTAHAATATAVGAGGTAVSGSFTFTYNGSSQVPTDAGAYAVVATFTSGDSGYTSTMAVGTITIQQTSPIVTLSGGTVAYDGTVHAITATALGVDGVTPVSGTFATTYNGSPTAPSAPGTYAVLATFTSSDSNNDYTNLTATDSLTITPAQLVVSAPSTATAGTPFSLTVTAQDAAGHAVTGFSGLVTLTSSSETDLAPSSILVIGGTATIPVTLTAAGSQTLTPAFPGLPATTATIQVSPGPFSQFQVTVQGSSAVQAGTAFLTTVQATDAFGNPITSYGGPASVTASISPTTTASNFPTTVPIGGSGLGLFLGDIQKAGTYTITAASGAYTGSASPVTVTPGAAVGLGFAAQPASTPTGVVLPAVTVQVLDGYGNVVTSDNTDTVTVAVAGGPGTFTAGSTTTATVHNGVATFSNLTLAAPGSYTLGAVVPALYTGPNSASFTVAPLQVVPTSFAGTPSGFSLQFNAPFLVNSLTPVLYGLGFGTKAPVPSVTLTQTRDGSGNPVNNPVAGSLVLNTTTNSISFVATNTTLQFNNGSPLLPDGTYTVIVHGSAAPDGFQAKNSGGGFLDGLGTGTPAGGDFTTTFVVNAAAAHQDALWVPATADGPGQALNAPGMNQVGGGYPIYLSDSTGNVTSVQATLNYDPALLTVTGVTGTGFALLGSSTAGHAVVQYSGPALPHGSPTPIGYLTAVVPAGTAISPTAYKAKDLLHLSGMSLNGGAIPVATSDGLHLVAYVGDSDGNGTYGSNDAVLITRVGLQTDSGFAAYANVDPVIVADTDGSGFIPADAALQANEAGVGFPTANLSIPPIPNGVHFQAVANNVDPSVSIPSDLHVAVDGTLRVPININDPHPAGSTGLTEAHLALTYDPRQFRVAATDIHLGSVLAAGNGWTITPTIDPVTGQIAIALSSATPITSPQGGSLVIIDFHQLNSGAPSGAISSGEPGGVSPRSIGNIALVASVSPGGQYVATELEDAQGTFTLTPAPTNAAASWRQDSYLAESIIATTVPANPEGADSAKIEISPPQPATSPLSSDESAAVSSLTPNPSSLNVLSSDEASAVSSFILHPSSLQVASAVSSFILHPSSLQGVFQFGSVPVIAAPGSGIGVGQPLADWWFQALAHGAASPYDAAQPVGTPRDSLERGLASQLRLSRSAADIFDDLTWDEVSSALEGNGTAEPAALRARHSRPDVTAHQITPAATAARAAVDQYFAQAADNAFETSEDE